MMEFLSFKLNRRIMGVWAISILIVIFSAQQLVIPNPFSPIKFYMPVIAALALYLIIRTWAFSWPLRYRPDNVDMAIIMLYGYMMFSAAWATNTFLALRMSVGIVILSLAYFVMRTVLLRLSTLELKIACIQASKLFIVLSLLYYVAGMYLHYMADVLLVMEEGATAAFSYGVFFGGGDFPRLRGICDSPNNFGIFAVFFLASLFLSDKLNRFYVIILIVMMIMTFSVTTYIAMSVMFIVFITKKYGLFSILVVGLLTIVVTYFIVLEIELFWNLFPDLSDRMLRIYTGSGRWEIFTYSLQKIPENLLFGHGLNQARDILEPLRSVRSTHNNFIEILLEGGLIGGMFYLSGLFVLAAKAWSLRYDKSLNLWAVLILFGLFPFSNANLTIYADSTILILSVLASMKSGFQFRPVSGFNRGGPHFLDSSLRSFSPQHPPTFVSRMDS